MHSAASFNFAVLDGQEPRLSALASAALYGKGIFTTLAIYQREPFLWTKHWSRLANNAATLGIDISLFAEQQTGEALVELIEQNDVTNGRARLTFFDESSGYLWPLESKRQTSLLITTADLRPSITNLRLTTSPHRINSTSPLAGVKSCNYLEKLIARDEAERRGFDECVQVNERGLIVSASMANIFWLVDGSLFTPSLATGCLAGTTREFVLENLECKEVEAAIGELKSADEIFLTSAGTGVVQVREFDGRLLNGEPHTITGLLPPLN